MAQESEKRFEAIMNKLLHTSNKSKPTSNNTRHGVETLSGKKRQYSSSLAGNVYEESGSSATSAQAPSFCRPWDRDDLFRRLSSFKSLTWFAKPQVVSPLDCARRGWVNVDIDTIACSSCEARLLFSTPSAWTQQQVEKAARVFSLKLESGHKLLCPWMNNTCTEELARFPIISKAGLIEDYKKRFLALSQLIALPVILPAAIDKVRSPHLEQFLTKFSGYLVPVEKPRTEVPGDIPESISSSSYYQAQKLISLFGWEPHMLPYTVDLKDGQKDQSVKDANIIFTTGQKQKVNVYSLCANNEGSKASGELQLDPSCVVLDCKLCGATVGLWAFCTIPRPVEYLRFVGLTEVNGQNMSSHDEMHTASTSLGFTIAGGPPPAMLNYGATISLPVIGQSLRAQFPIETDTTHHLAIQKLSQPEEDEHISLESLNVTTEGTSATSGPYIIAKSSSQVPQIFEEGSISNVNLSENVTTLNSAVEGDKCEQGTSNPRENKKLPSLCKSTEFDPIKQHRHFCPWIESNGKFIPGWQQTLSALEGLNGLSFFLPNNVPSSTLIEVDDPVACVKNLFTSPNEKRAKASG